jgi:GPH family glycoside/pentoside/hexuronide:cation symporter
VLVAYGGPAGGIGFMFLLVGIYLLKFSTDVLLVTPAAMGLLFGLSRIWDAVSDPLVGYLTDRTRTRFGRRRPWMLLGALPMAGAFAMLWSPPAALEGDALVLWMTVALLGFYSATTAVDVPHAALGAELTDDYEERTRLFGYRRMLFGVGSLAAVAAVQAFEGLDPRAAGRAVGVLAGGAAFVLAVVLVARVRERPEFQGRGARSPLAAARDVWRNGHARLLLAVFLLQQLAVTSIAVAIPFYAQYVLRTPGWTSAYLLSIFLASLLSVPVWMRLAAGRDKRRLIALAMVVSALALGAFALAPPGQPGVAIAIAACGGLGAGCIDVLMPSVQADVIDVDEHRTGERKEGAYFAGWAFAAKTAGGLASMGVGLGLAALGFEPNVEQPGHVVVGLRVLAGLLPALVYTAGLLLFLRFGLGPVEYGRVRAALDARRAGEAVDA